MHQNKDIAILLSTYNGEAYLEAFFNSVIDQTNQEYILFIRDDGSEDGTQDIINKFTETHANFVYIDSKGNLGSKLSFGALLEYVLSNFNFNYYMFADQDDVWLPDKVEKSLEKMKELESRYKGTPVLIHSDLKVVDKNLRVLSESFWKYQYLNPKFDQINRLIMQNVITGCTVMFNKELAKLSSPIPNQAIMHDWWMGLVASSFGKIAYIKEPTILYRQHLENTLGAKRFNLMYYMNRMMKPITIEKNVVQAAQFYNRYSKQLTSLQNELFLDFINLTTNNYFLKIYIIFKWKLFKIGIVRNIGLLLKIR